METRRPTSPSAEEILGGYFPVLDHGFVALVDYMGGDEDVERAARVSYGYGTRKRSATRGLIRYLRRHRHTTPSEMVELKFHCCMPIFVARQWIRHRTACLAAATELYFDLPGGIERRGNQLYKLTIEEIWRRFQPTRNRTRPDKQRNPYFKRDRVQGMNLRHLDEDTGEIDHTRIVDVYRNGPKPVYRMTLADGKAIECTADHRFLFADGWRTLREAADLRVKHGKAVWRSGTYHVHVNGSSTLVPEVYRDQRWLAREYVGEDRTAEEIADVCRVSVHTVRKWLRIHGVHAPSDRKRFTEGHSPWNRGLTYRTGPRELSEAWLEANSRARSGEASNFWKGGTSSDREAIGRWTTQAALRVHRRNGWTCQLCHQRSGSLHCHHVVPVWADPGRARDEENLTTLCAQCHRGIQGRELEYVERLGGPPVEAEWVPAPGIPWNRLTEARLVEIESFQYVGIRETYDLEVEGPHHNFVANGIVTHNSVNEYSGRYSLIPMLFYTPRARDFALQSRSNRQGRRTESAGEAFHREALRRWERGREEAAGLYEWLVGEEVARELARIDLPLSTYTQWYWKIDLHNLLHFLTLRVDPHAQYEIRAYGEVMAGMLKRVAPLSYEAWIDYQVAGTVLSRAELEALRLLLEPVDEEEGLRVRAAMGDTSGSSAGGQDGAGGYPGLSGQALRELGLSKREVRELLGKLRPAERPDFELDLSRMKSAEHFAELMERAVPRTDVEG